MKNWSCYTCGSNNPSEIKFCEVCGAIHQTVLVLRGENEMLIVARDVVIGRDHYRRLSAEDSMYCHASQFHCVFDQNTAEWTILHHSRANNPTYLNGQPLGPEPVTLAPKDVITIGPEKAPVVVSMEERRR